MTLYEQSNAPEKELTLTRRGRILRNLALAGFVAAGATYIGSLESEPTMSGNQTVVVHQGDTLEDLINNHVVHGESFTGDVEIHAYNDPANIDVFGNGQLDEGENLELPVSVTD